MEEYAITRYAVRQLPDECVEPEIRPLVHALNATGCVHTFGSCEGHPGQRDATPYVDLNASLPIAAAFARLVLVLRPDFGAGARLRLIWELNGRFPAGAGWTSHLAWRLSPSTDIRRTRSKVNDDVVALATALPRLAEEVLAVGRAPSLHELAEKFGACHLLESDIAGKAGLARDGALERPGQEQ